MLKMLSEVICIIAGLFILGTAGGLEKGLIGIPGALVAWAAAGAVILIAVKAGRRRSDAENEAAGPGR